jgi:hypothetical protein
MVKFEVKVIGHPKPKIRWLKHGEEVIPSDEFQIENLDDGTSILVINEIYPDDTGVIKFEAYNSVGVAETITQFVVEGTIADEKRFYHNKILFQMIIFDGKKICSKFSSIFVFLFNVIPCHSYYTTQKNIQTSN